MTLLHWTFVGIWLVFAFVWLGNAWGLHKRRDPKVNLSIGLWLVAFVFSLLAAAAVVVLSDEPGDDLWPVWALGIGSILLAGAAAAVRRLGSPTDGSSGRDQ